MDNSLMGMVDIIIIVCGVYLIYSAFKMKKDRKINNSLIGGKDRDFERCRDKDGIIEHMFPHMIGVGAIITAGGIVSYAGDMVQSLESVQNILLWIAIIVTLVALVWYIIAVRKVMKEYY